MGSEEGLEVGLSEGELVGSLDGLELGLSKTKTAANEEQICDEIVYCCW